MKPKKLLFIVNVDWYFRLHWLARAKAAANEGYQVHVACTITDKDHQQLFTELGFCVHRVPFARSSMNPFKEIVSFIHILILVWTLKPWLIHSITVKPNLYAGIICRLGKIRQVLAVTGLGRIFSHSGKKEVAARTLVRRIYTWISHSPHSCFTFENSEDKDSIFGIKHSKSNAVVIKGAGVDTDAFSYQPEDNTDKDGLKILFAARLLYSKGLQDLIDAVKILKKKNRPVHLQVAGIQDNDNPDAISEKQILKWHKQNDIEWLGQTTDINGLLKNISIVALPSSYGEGVPRILIEAASVGRPIIATNIAGCREIVQNGVNGYLVDIKSPNSIADALELLLENDKLRNEMGIKGRLLVEQHFSERQVVGSTLEIYGQLTG